jgi:hypothetical protein
MSTVTETEYTKTEEHDTSAPNTSRQQKKSSGIVGKLVMVGFLVIGLVAIFAAYSIFIKKPSASPSSASSHAQVVQPTVAPISGPALGSDTVLATNASAAPNLGSADQTLQQGQAAQSAAALLGAQASGSATPGSATPGSATGLNPLDPSAPALPVGTTLGGGQSDPNGAATAAAVPGSTTQTTTTTTQQPPQVVNPANAMQPNPLQAAQSQTTPGVTVAPSSDALAQFHSMLDPIDGRVTTLEGRVGSLEGTVNGIQSKLSERSAMSASSVETAPAQAAAAQAHAHHHRSHYWSRAKRNGSSSARRGRSSNQLEVISSSDGSRSSHSRYAINMSVQPPSQTMSAQSYGAEVVGQPTQALQHAQHNTCNLQAIVPGRAWVKLENGDFAVYSVGDAWSDGVRIAQIDPTLGVVTEGGTVVCR